MKAQVSAELLLMIGVSITIGILLIASISYFYTDQLKEKNIDTAKEILVAVENELFAASKVRAGYSRQFTLPATINNENYTVSMQGGDIILTYSSIDFIGSSPNVTGNIQKGANTVKNVGGKVCLNLQTC